MNSFETLTTFRSYDTWMLLRPGIESVLIMGKWIDDPENAAIWGARATRKTEYIKAFSGKGLISSALPRAVALKTVLDRLNDEFVHANEPYYHRHTTIQEAGPGHVYLGVDFFDGTEDAEVHTVAFLHLVAAMVDSMDEMLARVLPATGPHVACAPRLRTMLAERALRLWREAPQAPTVLAQLGLWPVPPTNPAS
jgi:hypothetical protein